MKKTLILSALIAGMISLPGYAAEHVKEGQTSLNSMDASAEQAFEIEEIVIEETPIAACPCEVKTIPCPTCEPCDKIQSEVGYLKEQSPHKKTLMDLIWKEPQFDQFEKLVHKAGLEDVFHQTGAYTVFIPTNEAIAKMSPVYLDFLKQPCNKQKLIKFVMNHVANNRNNAKCLCQEMAVTNLNGCQLSISQCDRWLWVDDAKILQTDINTKNGTIEVIDNVLDPFA